MMKPQLPATSKKGPQSSDRQRIAKTLFCLPEFAMTEFRQMDAEDWKLHAARAWEVAGIFVAEARHRSK